MSENISNILPAPFEFKLGALSYKFAPLTIGDLAALGSHIKQERIKQFRSACEGMEPALIAAGIERIIKDDSEISWSDASAMQFLIFRSLKKEQPEMTFEQVGDLLSVAAIAEVTALVHTIGGVVKNLARAQETATE
jgi:hypothetical protein